MTFNTLIIAPPGHWRATIRVPQESLWLRETVLESSIAL